MLKAGVRGGKQHTALEPACQALRLLYLKTLSGSLETNRNLQLLYRLYFPATPPNYPRQRLT
jgi:hypothetical protein